MNLSEWLLGALCVLAFILVIQVGMVWRILDSILNCVGWIKDIWLLVGNTRNSIISIRDKICAKPSKWNTFQTNMDHLKSIKSSKEMSKILNDAPWCPSANGDVCADPNGAWGTCAKCRERWLDAPYEEEKWCMDD